MSKIFTWIFGAISGILGTVVYVGFCICESPESWERLARAFKK